MEIILNYWIEKWDSVNQEAKIWVKVPNIPANGTTTFYMYYGNPNVTNASNGDTTFDIFANFETSDIDNNGSQEGISIESGTWKVKYNSVYQDYIHKLTKDPTVIKKNGLYYLFYTCANSGKGIAIARSTNKIDWKYLKTLSLEGYWNAWAPCIFEENGTYYLFWTSSTDSDWQSNSRVVYATSTDLENWTFQGELSGIPIGVIDIDIKKFDNTYYAYYKKHGTDEGIHVAMSSSITGSYTPSSNNPLLTATEAWEDNSIEAPCVFFKDGIYYLFYAGGDSANGGSIGVATSQYPDKDFVKQGQITITPSAEWFSVAKTHPWVCELDGEIELWFCGTEIAEHKHEISYAMAENFPLSWNLIPQKMFRCVSTSGDQVAIFSGVSMKNLSIRGKMKSTNDGNVYLIWRKTNDSYYQISIRVNVTSPYVRLESPVGGWHEITTASIDWEVDDYKWQEYEVRHYENHIQIYINGTKLIDVNNTEITSAGNMGLKTYNEIGDFDNLIVRKYVEPEPSVNIGKEEAP